MTLEQQQKLAQLELQLAKNPKAAATLFSLSGYLLSSEYELILFMYNSGNWQGPLPPAPAGFQAGDGSIEFGLFLYWFNNPSLIDSFEIMIIAAAMDKLMKLPDSQMTAVNYEFLCNNELIYVDGTVLSTETYATYDQGWFAAFINLLQTVLYDTWYNKGNFPFASNPAPVALSGAAANTVNIALVGDWGTGDPASAAVMQQIVSLNPDYIIHLGDVYYGGTPTANDPNSSHYYVLNEEINNLVQAWPAQYAGRSFTLNSNHEMYSGANGYFYDALLANNTPFSAQQGLSCFLLQFGGWNILGLDSAFNGTSLDAFMSGNIGDAGGAQATWIKSLNLNPAKTIVLTHHTGFEYDCSSVDNLWSQVNAALGNDPYAWYWGHAHNGIVYNNPVTINTPGQPSFSTNTYARCAGHGALPYGLATALQNNPNILWQAASAQPAPSQQVYNGFVMLTLQASNGQLTNITEAFYDGSSTMPTRSESIYAG